MLSSPSRLSPAMVPQWLLPFSACPSVPPAITGIHVTCHHRHPWCLPSQEEPLGSGGSRPRWEGGSCSCQSEKKQRNKEFGNPQFTCLGSVGLRLAHVTLLDGHSPLLPCSTMSCHHFQPFYFPRPHTCQNIPGRGSRLSTGHLWLSGWS